MHSCLEKGPLIHSGEVGHTNMDEGPIVGIEQEVSRCHARQLRVDIICWMAENRHSHVVAFGEDTSA